MACRRAAASATAQRQAGEPSYPRPWIRISSTAANLGPSGDPDCRDNYASPSGFPAGSVLVIDGSGGTPARTRIVLADDHTIVRSALRALLEADGEFEVVAEAGDVDEAVRKALAYKPDVIVLDLSMPGGSSLNAIPRMREASQGTAVVVLTMEDEPRFAREAFRAGALGFVLKEAADTELVAAVRAAVSGLRYLNPQLGGLLAMVPDAPPGPPDGLTEREVDVLRLVALGHTNAEISDQLYLSVRTVESHRAHIQQKIGRTTRAELVAYAREQGLLAVDPGP
jgi:two-component system, NarL family, response regulator NreC